MIADALVRGIRGHVLGEGDEGELLLGGMRTAAGERVSAETALKVSAVYACTTIITGGVRMMPLLLTRDIGNDVLVPERRHRLWPILHKQPNDEMGAGEFFERLAWSAILRGNGYGWLERDDFGRVVGLWPLNQDRVEVDRHPITRRKRFSIWSGDDRERVSWVGTTDDIIHVKGDPGPDPLLGVSVIHRLREIIGRALSEDRHAATTMKNQGRPSGILSVKGKLDKDRAIALRERWQAAHGGSSKAGRTAVLEEGAKWEPVVLSAADLELVKQRAISREDIAIAFKVPGDMVLAGSAANLHYSTDATRDVRLVKHGITPWTLRIQEALEVCPSLPWGEDLYPRFNPAALLKADIKTRYEAHQIGLDAGFLTYNEVRAEEDREPIDGLDRTKPQLDPDPSKRSHV